MHAKLHAKLTSVCTLKWGFTDECLTDHHAQTIDDSDVLFTQKRAPECVLSIETELDVNLRVREFER